MAQLPAAVASRARAYTRPVGKADDDRFCVIRIKDGHSSRIAAADMGDIDRLRKEPDTLIWLNVRDPKDHDLALLEREFGLHPLALEDLRKRSQRPKIDTYPDQHMIVAFEAIAGEADQCTLIIQPCPANRCSSASLKSLSPVPAIASKATIMCWSG